ncbi:MAG: winged helix-turn-helix domain-containing protein [Rhizobiaceae bacterium]
MTIKIPNQRARRHFMARQGLAASPRKALSRDDLLAMVHDLGFVQVDSIGTVERAHHHILFSRNQTYRQRDLHRLIENDRQLFEHWTHDASIIPAEFYPYWRHRFLRERDRLQSRWWKERLEAGRAEMARVIERIGQEGPLRTRDFEARDKPSTGWWDWHPSKAALEFLWRTGELAIARRDGFQKVYDLAANVIPAVHYEAEVDHHAFVDWACRSALRRLGFASRGEIAAFWDLLSPTEVEQWIVENRKDLLRLEIETVDGGRPRPALALASAFDPDIEPPEPPARLRILSPFDPLLRDRARAQRLFGFHYRIEIFVPQAKRRYGYYVFPVMRGDRMVGRIDAKAERESDRLFVRAFWPEPGTRVSAALLGALEAELERMRRFAGVGTVAYAPDWLRN